MMQRQPDITGNVPASQGNLHGVVPLRTTSPDAVALPPNAAWSQEVEPGATLVVRAGSAWVTFEGDPEDHILDAGATFTAPARGRLAAQALSPLELELAAAAPRRAA